MIPGRKRWQWALLGLLLIVVASLVAVAIIQVTASSYATVVAALRAHGATVQEDGLGVQPFLGGTDHRLTVNGAGVDVFEYRTAIGSSLDASHISADGSTISSGFGPVHTATTVDFIAPPHWFHSGRVIVLYVGHDSNVLTLLHVVLGTQFAGG
jgi:hypothetical protein